MGRKLTSLQKKDGELPGFMKVGPALRNSNGTMIGALPYIAQCWER